MNPILATIRKRRLTRRIHYSINRLSPAVTPYVERDDWGDYVAGFRSSAIDARARHLQDDHEPESWPWFEAEAARLFLRVLADDALGDRTLVLGSAVDDISEEIIARTRRLVPAWLESV